LESLKMKSFVQVAAIVVGLTGCAVPQNEQSTSSLTAIERRSTDALWSQYLYLGPSFARKVALIEVELARRGETVRNGSYVGENSSAYTNKQYHRAEPKKANVLNCSDFSSSAQAQKAFLLSGGPAHDRHGLDRDGDGLACEWGAALRQNKAKARAALAKPAQRYRAPTCHIGPRGGRYYYSSSGRKVYGC
jgi:hypothetical protein